MMCSRTTRRAALLHGLTAAICLAGIWLIGGCKQRTDSAETSRTRSQRLEPDALEARYGSIIASTSAELPRNPTRLVALAPNLTEIVYALDQGDKLVATTKHADYPETAQSLPKVGSGVSPDVEKLVSHKPDLVFGLASRSSDDLISKLDRLEVPYVFVELETIENILDGIRLIGQLAGAPGEGQSTAQQLQTKIQNIRGASGRPAAKKPSTLLIYGRRPLVVAGPDTFGDQLIDYAGGKNAVGHLSTELPKLDIEKVIELDPAIIVDASVQAQNQSDPRTYWSQYSSISAVKHDRVSIFENPSVLRPGPRLPRALAKLHETIRSFNDER